MTTNSFGALYQSASEVDSDGADTSPKGKPDGAEVDEQGTTECIVQPLRKEVARALPACAALASAKPPDSKLAQAAMEELRALPSPSPILSSQKVTTRTGPLRWPSRSAGSTDPPCFP